MPTTVPTLFRKSALIWLLAVSALLAGAGCANPPAADYRLLKRAPVMPIEAEEEAVALELASDAAGPPSALADFAWKCDAYGAYIDCLRGGEEDCACLAPGADDARCP